MHTYFLYKIVLNLTVHFQYKSWVTNVYHHVIHERLSEKKLTVTVSLSSCDPWSHPGYPTTFDFGILVKKKGERRTPHPPGNFEC